MENNIKAREFIILHDFGNNSPIIFRTDNINGIEYYDAETDDGKKERRTLIYFNSPLEVAGNEYMSTYVYEKVEKIYQMIYGLEK